jgi:hypothetical protein
MCKSTPCLRLHDDRLWYVRVPRQDNYCSSTLRVTKISIVLYPPYPTHLSVLHKPCGVVTTVSWPGYGLMICDTTVKIPGWALGSVDYMLSNHSWHNKLKCRLQSSCSVSQPTTLTSTLGTTQFGLHLGWRLHFRLRKLGVKSIAWQPAWSYGPMLD